MASMDGRLPEFRGALPLRRHGDNAVRKVLLAAGALSSLLYVVATDGVAASMWDGYSRTEQMVSELFAVGSPGRGVLVPVTWLYTLLFTAFGIGAWNSVKGNRALRVGAGLLIGYGLSNILGAFYPLTLNEAASIPMHIVATNIQLALMVSAMCFVAMGFHGRMRVYSFASLGTCLIMGVVAFMAAPGPSLVLGIGERISIGSFLAWVVVLAAALWAAPASGRSATTTSAKTGG